MFNIRLLYKHFIVLLFSRLRYTIKEKAISYRPALQSYLFYLKPIILFFQLDFSTFYFSRRLFNLFSLLMHLQEFSTSFTFVSMLLAFASNSETFILIIITDYLIKFCSRHFYLLNVIYQIRNPAKRLSQGRYLNMACEFGILVGGREGWIKGIAES